MRVLALAALTLLPACAVTHVTLTPARYEVVTSQGTGTRMTPASSALCGSPNTPSPCAAASGSKSFVDMPP